MKKVVSMLFVCLLLFVGCEKKDAKQIESKNDFVVVELRSDTLMVFDLPGEAVRYKIPNFESGRYKIPFKAIRNAPEEKAQREAGSIIVVDTGKIFFVDADYYDKLRQIERRIWEETKDMSQFTARYDAIANELGIKYNFFTSSGVGPSYDFAGDGSYVLDTSLIQRLPN